MLTDHHWKKNLKARLTTGQVDGLRRMREFSEHFPEIMMACGLGLLGTSRAVQVKERLSLKGRLDYDRAEIWLTLDSSMSLHRLNGCAKEPDTVAWLEKCFKSGDVLYDIGANVGAYSFVAHAVAHGNCLVYAFEPSFNTFAALSQNVLLNRSEGSIVPLHIALSDKTSLVDFHYGSLAPGASMHAGIGGSRSSNVTASCKIPTLCYRLDDLVRLFNLRSPNHIKIDVDGPELNVLEGASELLDSNELRSVLVEVDEKRYAEGQIERILKRHGFGCTGREPRLGPQLYNMIFQR